VRRRNIFAILGKDESDSVEIENFNSEYFEQLNIENNDEPVGDESPASNEKTKFYPHGLKNARINNNDDELNEVT